jgi:4-hydroxy-3-polyprenylbenzoate decarboxylase
LTNIAEQEQNITFNSKLLPEEVVADTTLLYEWSTLLLFADNDLQIEFEKIAESTNCNFIVIFDKRAKNLSPEELLWLGAANTEPLRDFILYDSTLVIDARAKRPNTDNTHPSRWPNIVTSDEATINLVDSKWGKYKIGKFISSPSNHYRMLQLCDGAQWRE